MDTKKIEGTIDELYYFRVIPCVLGVSEHDAKNPKKVFYETPMHCPGFDWSDPRWRESYYKWVERRNKLIQSRGNPPGYDGPENGPVEKY